mmetsp:Transcript_77377/g.206568  ORF Transcript_77377/g.206568 Transcript_77377/m.206568 type:complete len:359 (+) Transcript_77377:710-1786(+)
MISTTTSGERVSMYREIIFRISWSAAATVPTIPGSDCSANRDARCTTGATNITKYPTSTCRGTNTTRSPTVKTIRAEAWDRDPGTQSPKLAQIGQAPSRPRRAAVNKRMVLSKASGTNGKTATEAEGFAYAELMSTITDRTAPEARCCNNNAPRPSTPRRSVNRSIMVAAQIQLPSFTWAQPVERQTRSMRPSTDRACRHPEPKVLHATGCLVGDINGPSLRTEYTWYGDGPGNTFPGHSIGRDRRTAIASSAIESSLVFTSFFGPDFALRKAAKTLCVRGQSSASASWSLSGSWKVLSTSIANGSAWDPDDAAATTAASANGDSPPSASGSRDPVTPPNSRAIPPCLARPLASPAGP